MSEKVKSEKMEKMEALRKQLADLESGGLAPHTDMPKQSEEGLDSDDEVERRAGTRPRRERTAKQKEAFVKAQATRLAKAEERKKEKVLKEQEEKEELEKKLIEKAIKVKKKQIKKMAVIEQLSDDDTPIERKPVSAPSRPHIYVKPKMIFV
jgi:hypothetical protein